MPCSAKSRLHVHLPGASAFCNLGAFPAHPPESAERNDPPKGMRSRQKVNSEGASPEILTQMQEPTCQYLALCCLLAAPTESDSLHLLRTW